MKAEINNENKARFFAQYWGQIVLSNGVEIGGCVGDCEEDLFLFLKPLSSISDEDLLWCYHKHSELIAYDYTMDFKPFLDMANHWRSNEEDWEKSVTRFSQVSDYLRSKGYAIPWMGLSVEEMVEAGWIQIV